MQESPCIVQLVLKKKMSMETSCSKRFARHFILGYLNTTCLRFDQKSKKYAYILSFISKLFKNQENKYEIFHHINHAITYNHVKYVKHKIILLNV